MRGLELRQVAEGESVNTTIKKGPEAFSEAPTKRIDLHFYFVSNNTSTGFTVANILTQAGSTLTIDTGLPIKKVVDLTEMADLFYLLWQYLGRAPPNFGGNTNNYICGVTFPIWFGRPWRANEGLPPTNINISWTVPNNANEIDGASCDIVQYVEPQGVYDKCLVYASKDGPTPSTSLRKNFPFPLHDLDQQVLIDLIFQTTGVRTTNATTTIEDFYLMKDNVKFGDKMDIEFLMQAYKPPKEDVAGIATVGIIEDYQALDWRQILGRPFVPSLAGVQSSFGINFLGGDTNAVRDIQLAYVPL